MSRRWSGQWAQPLRHSVPQIDVLIPTVGRVAELAVTLAGLAAQDDPPFRVILSDQSEREDLFDEPAVAALLRILQAQGRPVELHRNMPRRGLAHQRHFLLQKAQADYVLFLDDDVWLEPGTLGRLSAALTDLDCGFVGCAVQGLSYLRDWRPREWKTFERWTAPVTPEVLTRSSAEFGRWPLHNAANMAHIASYFPVAREGWIPYKVAWVGGCALYHRERLESCGGFDFWDDLPQDHVGEDVVAQWRVMKRYGAAGILPSGAVHLESPTTIPRDVPDAPDLL